MKKKPMRKSQRKPLRATKRKRAAKKPIVVPDTLLAVIKAGIAKGTIAVVKLKPAVVKITDGVASPTSQHVKRIIVNRIKWRSTDDRGYSVEFKDGRWPFVEAPCTIEVPPGGDSAPYTVYRNAEPGTYDYAIYGGKPGPGVPDVIVDP